MVLEMNSEKLNEFERAFSSGMAGCVRTCECGRVFYDNANSYDWEPGELERLQASKKATPVDYSVGTLVLEGGEFVQACNCWHERASKIIDWLDNHAHGIAEYLTLEKKRKQADADHSPVVR